jgi:hypothetical protein
MRRIRTSFRHITVSRWFPANDEIAASMARLCVLREDLYLELQGMKYEPIPLLDECSADWREIYFFRNTMRTLAEITRVIHKLRCNKPFVEALEKGSKPVHGAFVDLSKSIGEASALIDDLRNEVGGHILEKPIKEGLALIGQDTKGLFQDSHRFDQIHYHFAMEFVGATILRRVDYENAEEEWKRILKTTLKLGFDAVPAIDIIFRAYQHMRSLRE